MKVRIQRYDTSRAAADTVMEEFLPQHVTITGNEDHFHLAVQDAYQLIAGMRLLDTAMKLDRDKDGKPVKIIYRILSITEH